MFIYEKIICETPQLLKLEHWLYSAENFDAIHVLHRQEAEKSMRERKKSLGQKEKRKKGEATVYKSGQSALHNLNYINQFIGNLSRAIFTIHSISTPDQPPGRI